MSNVKSGSLQVIFGDKDEWSKSIAAAVFTVLVMFGLILAVVLFGAQYAGWGIVTYMVYLLERLLIEVKK